MRRVLVVAFAIVTLTGVNAWTQDAGSAQTDQKMSSAKATLVSISGTVSDDGKALTADKDQKSWTVQNPEALKGHEGHHVRVRAHVYADKGEIHVMSVKMLGAAKKTE